MVKAVEWKIKKAANGKVQGPSKSIQIPLNKKTMLTKTKTHLWAYSVLELPGLGSNEYFPFMSTEQLFPDSK